MVCTAAYLTIQHATCRSYTVACRNMTCVISYELYMGTWGKGRCDEDIIIRNFLLNTSNLQIEPIYNYIA